MSRCRQFFLIWLCWYVWIIFYYCFACFFKEPSCFFISFHFNFRYLFVSIYLPFGLPWLTIFTRGGQLSKNFVDYFFDIFTLFAPQYTCFFVGQDNNKDNNSITLVPTLGFYVGFCIKLDKIVAKMCHR
jgi:hypothetical protein